MKIFFLLELLSRAKYMEIAGGEIWTVWQVLHRQFSVLEVDGLPNLSPSYTNFFPF
jgi:hypothetical protein